MLCFVIDCNSLFFDIRNMIECNLQDKICVVTGAGRGIGKDIAIRLAHAGAHVVCVSKNVQSCSAVAQLINSEGFSAEYLAVDVADNKLVAEACSTILSKYGNVDVLINNAGITRDNLIMRMSDEDWIDVLNTNLSGCFFWTKNLIRSMLKNKWGRIINISSIVGCVGNAGQCNYSAAKAGILGFTKSIAREVASRGITVNAIAPGFIRTDMTDSLNESIVEKIKENIPLKKFGEVSDISAVVEFLCSQGAQYITGQVIHVDGGMYM